MIAADVWLRHAGAVKLQLMVRRGNDEALAFYARLGFVVNDVSVSPRWLEPVDDGDACGASVRANGEASSTDHRRAGRRHAHVNSGATSVASGR